MALATVMDRTQTELRPVTFEDYLALPDDGVRYELIFGELMMSPAPGMMHQHVILELASEFLSFVRKHRAGRVFVAPFDVKLSKYSVVQPDVLVILRNNLAILNDDRVEGAPDIVVEVLSPSSRRRDLVAKMALYAEHGVPEYWAVDSKTETIEVLVLEGGRYLAYAAKDGIARSRVLPGFEVDPTALFPMQDLTESEKDAGADDDEPV
ncbi:MAG: Uma2 family endonuclease [Thermomicrobiales bacterium]